MNKIAISKDGTYQLSHGPHMLYKQMKYFENMKIEMLETINRQIDSVKLQLDIDELYLKNEDFFF